MARLRWDWGTDPRRNYGAWGTRLRGLACLVAFGILASLEIAGWGSSTVECQVMGRAHGQ